MPVTKIPGRSVRSSMLRPGQARRRRGVTRRPCLECLEDRTLLDAAPAAPDLVVTKTGPATVTAGTTTTDYTVTVTNAGSAAAVDVTLSDFIPSGVEVVTPFAGSTFDSRGFRDGIITASEPSLAPGASVQLVYHLRIDASDAAGSTLVNIARVISTTPESDTSNNSTSFTSTVVTSADLAVSNIDTPDPVTAGSDLTYSVVIANNGPSDAQAVTVTDALPAGTTFVSVFLEFGTGWSTSAPAVGGTGSIVFSKATAPDGDLTIFAIVVHVNANVAKGSTISNTATVASATSDPDPANNTPTGTTTVATAADLVVTQSFPRTSVAGGDATFTMTLENNGPSDARKVTLTDALPERTTLVSASVSSGSGWSTSGLAVGGEVVFSKLTMPAGEKATFTIVVHIDANVAQFTSISNRATAASAESDPKAFNNDLSVSTQVTTSADVAVTITDLNDPVVAGDNITYTISVTNNGPSDARNYGFSETPPIGTSFVSIIQTGGVPVFLALPPGSTATFQVTLHVHSDVPPGTILTVSASAASTTPDPDQSNNVASATTTVTALADLAVTKIDLPDPVIAGTDLTYTINLANNGPRDAQGVVVSDAVPLGTTFRSAAAQPGWSLSFSAITNTLTFTNPTVAAGATASLTMVVHVGANVAAGSTIANTVTATSTSSDPDPSNNDASALTTVNTSADLAVSKVASPSPVTVGSNLTYTITLNNNGPSDAQAVSLTDGIPAGANFVSATAPGGWTTTAPAVGGTGSVSFNRASVAAGAAANFTIVVQVSSAFNAPAVSNTVNVSSTTPDPDSGNNSFTNNTPAQSPVDLVVTETTSGNPVFPGGNVTYTVTVHNAGTLPAVDVKLYDLLPDRTTFVSNSGALGWTGTSPPVGSGGVITGAVASFAGGATATFVIVVKVDSAVRPGNVLTNRAIVTTSSGELNGANNSTTAQVTVGNPPPAGAPAVKAPVVSAAPGGSSKGSPSPTLATINARAQDLVLSGSSGLVADVLRQKTLSGLLAFGG